MGQAQPRYRFEIAGVEHDMSEGEFAIALIEALTTLVFEKRADLVTLTLKMGEKGLAGAGDENVDPLSVCLFRHLKDKRAQGPSPRGPEGRAISFHLHSIVDALLAVVFFLRAGELAPSFVVTSHELPVLTATDRGLRTRLLDDNPELLERLARRMPGPD